MINTVDLPKDKERSPAQQKSKTYVKERPPIYRGSIPDVQFDAILNNNIATLTRTLNSSEKELIAAGVPPKALAYVHRNSSDKRGMIVRDKADVEDSINCLSNVETTWDEEGGGFDAFTVDARDYDQLKSAISTWESERGMTDDEEIHEYIAETLSIVTNDLNIK
jgi:hypothetical protein